jgi:hypothetical protein
LQKINTQSQEKEDTVETVDEINLRKFDFSQGMLVMSVTRLEQNIESCNRSGNVGVK